MTSSKETMKQFTLIAAIVICLINSTYGQNKTYFGLEVSVASDLYKITDNGEYLINSPIRSGQVGLTIRQEINKSIFVESGLILKAYGEGFGFRTPPPNYYYVIVNNEHPWMIPLRFGLSLNLHKEKIYLVPIVGYSFGVNPPSNDGLGHDQFTSGGTTIEYYYSENPDVSRYYSLLQTGIGLEFKLSKTLLASITANYYNGFNKTTHMDITYTVNYSAPTTGTVIGKGEFWCVGGGLKFAISNIWTRKKEQ